VRPAPVFHSHGGGLRLAPAPFFADTAFHAVAAVPPPPLAVEQVIEPEEDYIADRGFFSGDRVELILVLQDVRTGSVLWQNVIRDSIDPRDAAAVKKALDQALAGQSWASEPH